ncbi:MAG TPA: DUF4221 family protein [Saprospiraceae bacterium]|nr:DUF4221 family protein [Saprospiraceae bacterium]HMP15017.1 DUF4221 family protein [Saprospiraceae bacterium]
MYFISKHSFIFILINITIFACTKERGTTGYLEKIGHVELPLPPGNDSYSYTVKYYHNNDGQYLFWHNNFNHSILVYDLEKKEIAKIMRFEREGPEKLYKIQGFTVLSADSVYLATELAGKLYLVNGNGKIVQQLIFADTEDLRNANNYTSMNSKYTNDLYRIHSDSFLIPLKTPFMPGSSAQSGDEVYSIFRVVNTRNQTYRNTGLQAPKALFVAGKNPLPFLHCSTYDGEKLYYSFESDHNIYYSADFKTATAIEAASMYKTKFQPLNPNMTPYEYYARIFFYSHLIYDPYRNLFYRVVKLPIREDHQSNDEYRTEYEYPPRFSIMILDKNGRTLHEQLFEDTGLNMYIMFVGKQGLYISASSPANPAFDEQALLFDIYAYNP